jgi:hypothetical protein
MTKPILDVRNQIKNESTNDILDVRSQIKSQDAPQDGVIDVRSAVKPTEEVARSSDPFKQGVAGVTDAFTTLPAMAGYVGAAGEAVYNNLTEDEDRSIVDHFEDAASSGIDADLILSSATARNYVNDAFNIKEPVSIEDQAARILGSFVVPIPGSAAPNLLNKAASFVLPIVRRGPGFGKRVAQQAVFGGAIGTGIDQGIRALHGDPLLFSEQALTGKAPTALDVRDQIVQAPDIQALRDLDDQIAEQQSREDSIQWAAGSALLLSAAILGRKPIGKAIQKVRKPKELGNQLHEDMMDSSTALETSLRDLGMPDDVISHVIHNSHTDPTDMALNWLNMGELGQDFAFPARLKPLSFSQINEKFMALKPAQQQKFNDAMTASVDKIERLKGKDTNLWKNGRKTSTEIDQIIRAGTDDDQIKDLMNSMGQQYELMLRYQVHRGTMTHSTAAALMNRARINGRVGYMPIYRPDERGFMKRMADKYLSVGGKTQREASYLAEFSPSDPTSGGKHLSPLDAYRKYSIHTIADANEQSFKAHLLDKLAQVGRNMDGGEYLKIVPGTGNLAKTARDTTYIGRSIDINNPQSIDITKIGHPKKSFHGKTLSDLQKEFPDEIVTARYNDEIRVYHVPDKGLRAALELSPRLSNNLQTASAWKNLFTRGTTGNLSVFAPISHAFSAQQVALNMSARHGIGAGIKSVYDGLKGTVQIMAIDGAKNVSTYLGQRIARHFAKTGAEASLMKGLQKRLDDRIRHTMLNQVRRESGRTQSGIGNVGHGTLDEIMESVGRNSADYFGKDQMGLVGNLWKTWNNAWHEGPAYGAMLQNIGREVRAGNTITPQILRDSVDISKSVAGDMRRRGASGFAEAFNASVPFSAAMLQSWNSIGAAAKHDFGKFMIGASALIGVPTLSELAWNKSVSAGDKTWTDKKGKQWTYDDYYWNGFTTQQRVDNFIAFDPSKPPWEAVIVPVSPEWGLFRGVVIEAADALFDLSNVGAMSGLDQDKTNRSHWWTSLARVTDVPLPPVLAAGLSYFGADVQLGFKQGVNNAAGEAPGEQMDFIRNIPVGQGDRYGRATKFDNGHMDETTAAMIQDIFGAAGAAYVSMYDAMLTGVKGKDGGILEGVDRTLEAFGGALKSQARYVQPLAGKQLHPNASGDEITKGYIASKKSMQNLSRQVDKDIMRAGRVYADGQEITGDAVAAGVQDDPINAELAVVAKKLLGSFSTLDQQINQLHQDIKSIPNSRNLGSLQERNDQRDAMTLELQSKRAQVLSLIHKAEMDFGRYLSTRYGRNIEFRFSTFEPRAQLPTGSMLEELRKTPQSSQ